MLADRQTQKTDMLIAILHCPSGQRVIKLSLHKRPSVLQLGVRKSIRPSDEVLVWLSVWSEVQIVCIWSS